MPLTTAERQERYRAARLRQNVVRVDLHVPSKLHRKLRARAKAGKQTIKAMVVDILEDVLAREI